MDIRTAIARAPVVLDGGLATTLAAAGHELDTPLWSARLLAEDPVAISTVHGAFLDAGSEVLTTASYQASVEGFSGLGLSGSAAREAIRLSVELAREAIAAWRWRSGSSAPRWVAGSVGPYGALLADGSEYTGDYELSTGALADVHAERIALLVGAGADLLAIETQPRLDEALVALGLARAHGADAWVSFTTHDGEVLPDGTPFVEAAAAATAGGALAVGVNCCAPPAAERAVRAVGPGVVTVSYPNVGDRWDDVRRAWLPRAVPSRPVGADLVGGCCGTSPRHLAALVEWLATTR